jgi:hypothetical protein
MKWVKFLFLVIILSCQNLAGARAPDSSSMKPPSVAPFCPPKYTATASIVATGGTMGSSGFYNGQQAYLYNQNCTQSPIAYQLNNGTNHLVIPMSGKYVISYFIQAFNNNGGSVEGNYLRFDVNYLSPGGSNQLVQGGTMQPVQTGGSCNYDCSKWNVGYTWQQSTPATYFIGGTIIWLSGQETHSDTSCDGSSVLITAGVFTFSKH